MEKTREFTVVTRGESVKYLKDDIDTLGKIEWSEQAAHYSRRLMFSSLFLLALGYFEINSNSSFFGLKIDNFNQSVLFIFMAVIATYWMVRFAFRVVEEWSRKMPVPISGLLFGQHIEWQENIPTTLNELAKLHEESFPDEAWKGVTIDEHYGYINEFRKLLKKRISLLKIVKRRLIYFEVVPPSLFYAIAITSPLWKTYL